MRPACAADWSFPRHEHSREEPAVAKTSIAILAAAAAAVSLYLTITALIGTVPVGCGKGLLDCESALATRWSTWLGLPVSALGFSAYATLAGVACLSLLRLPPRLETACRSLTLALVAVVAAAGLWFLAVQAAVIGRFCLYCMAIHGCGLATVVAAGVALRPSLRELSIVGGVGLIAGAALAAGQITSLNQPPEKVRYRVALDPDLKLEAPLSIPWRDNPADAIRQPVVLLNGQLRLEADARPWLGDPQAPLVMAKLFDYTCGHCRGLHRQLAALNEREPGRCAAMLIHVPLSRKCNPYASESDAGHEQACDLSRLALAVWLAAPESFVEFDHWLCAGESSRSAEQARLEAARLVGEERLSAALANPLLGEILTENVDLYAFEEIPLLPSLLTPRRIMSGSYRDLEQLEQVLGQEPGY